MEAVTIKEIQKAPSYRKNQMMLIMRFVGICGVDHSFVADEDPTSLSDAEASSLLSLANDFEFSDCNVHYVRGILWMMLEGLIFRLLAYLALRFLRRHKKV